MTGSAINSVVKLLTGLGSMLEYDDAAMHDLPCKPLQCDEIWSIASAWPSVRGARSISPTRRSLSTSERKDTGAVDSPPRAVRAAIIQKQRVSRGNKNDTV